MKVIYTENPTKEPDIVFRDPRIFFGVIRNVTEGIVDGDYPEIVQVYKLAGIEVNAEQKKTDDPTNPSDMKVDQIKEILTAKGIEFPDNAKKVDLVKLLEEAGVA